MHSVSNPVACKQCPLQDCKGLRPLEEHQLGYMQDYKDDEVRVPKGELLVRQDETTDHLFTLLEGLLIRYRELEDGRRQIVNFMFPGDLVGLQGAFHEPSSHSVEALIDARLCVFKRGEFKTLIGTHPQLGYDITWLAAKEETALEEHIVALGRRSARERVAYLAVWLIQRARGVGMAGDSNRMAIPIRQAQIADMLGLSLVHTNRTIKSLERDGLVEWKSGEVCVPDLEKAGDFAKFDTSGVRPRPFI